MSIILTVIEGPHQGRVFTFEGHETFIVGRSPTAQFSLPAKDKYFSRRHFLIEANSPFCRLVDLKSHNGTLVNGKPTITADLKDGDRITAGTTTILVNIVEKEEFATADLPAQPQHTPLLSDQEQQRLTRSVSQLHLTGVSQMPTAEGGNDEQPRVLPEIPGFIPIRELGRGGMGVVFEANRVSDGLQVALKTILPAVRPDPQSLARFRREININRQLKHPNIVACLDDGEYRGMLWFAMEYISGTDAGKIVQKQGPMPLPRALSLTIDMLEALAYAHDAGFIHRDLKPSNLLVTERQGREVGKLADFGLAKCYQSSRMSGLTVAGGIGGTPQFMPPEQVLDFRSVGPAADQYATAATLYYLLTAKTLLTPGKSMLDMLMQVLETDPPPIRSHRPELPDTLEGTLMRAMARQPEARFPHVKNFREALASIAARL